MVKNNDNKLTSIVLVIDRSGSMSSIEKATQDALEEFVNSQLEIDGDLLIDTVFFDDNYEERAVDVDPKVEKLDLSLTPRGMTAMHDAIGRKITSFSEKLEKAESKPEVILFVIATDGLENASKEYTAEINSKLIKEKQKDGWNFTFIGANQDAVETAATLNISKDDAITFTASNTGIKSVVDSMSTYSGLLRSARTAAYSDEDRKNALKD